MSFRLIVLVFTVNLRNNTMRLSARIKRMISFVIISISILTWIILFFNPGQNMGIAHCHVSAAGPSAESWEMLVQMNPISSLLMGWLVMVIAMMLPKLIFPIQQIYAKSFKHIRFPVSFLFVVGYVVVWTIVGLLMVFAILGLNLWFPNSYLPATGVALIALIWQFSPIKQKFLNRGHDHKTLSAFGWSAYQDSFVYGIEHGIWCVGSGWALMLFPMLLPQGHNAAMLLVTFIMISEHLEHPQKPVWKLESRLKLYHYAKAQLSLIKK